MPGGPKSEPAPRRDAADSEVRASGDLPEVPRLPERAAIYIAPDGTVQFGALFEGLVPVAQVISGGTFRAAPGSDSAPDGEG